MKPTTFKKGCAKVSTETTFKKGCAKVSTETTFKKGCAKVSTETTLQPLKKVAPKFQPRQPNNPGKKFGATFSKGCNWVVLAQPFPKVVIWTIPRRLRLREK